MRGDGRGRAVTGWQTTCKKCGCKEVFWYQSPKTGKWMLLEGQRDRFGAINEKGQIKMIAHNGAFHQCKHQEETKQIWTINIMIQEGKNTDFQTLEIEIIPEFIENKIAGQKTIYNNNEYYIMALKIGNMTNKIDISLGDLEACETAINKGLQLTLQK